MKVIILGFVPYKEKDVIVSAISEESFISFSIKGGLDNKNKNSGLTNIFTIADITLSEGNTKYKYLKSSDVIYSPLIGKTSIEYMMALSLLGECFKKLLQDQEKVILFNRLEKGLYSLKNMKYPHMVLISLIGEMIKIGGYELNVNCCSLCDSRKNIIGFSFLEGGLVCSECFNESGVSIDLNLAQSKILRNALVSKDLDFSGFDYELSDLKFTLNKLLEFVYDSFGVKFKNIELL